MDGVERTKNRFEVAAAVSVVEDPRPAGVRWSKPPASSDEFSVLSNRSTLRTLEAPLRIRLHQVVRPRMHLQYTILSSFPPPESLARYCQEGTAMRSPTVEEKQSAMTTKTKKQKQLTKTDW